MTAPPAGALEACLALIKGEGDVKHSTQVRKRRECDNCGEPATKRISYCYVNGRRNPASSMYGRDDCTYCSDAEAFSCDKCEREVERACCPDGMNWGGTFTANAPNAHMFLQWVETDSPALLAALRLREAFEGLVDSLPSNWCDPMLTGRTAAIGTPPYDCPKIESLIAAIKQRLRDNLARAMEESATGDEAGSA